MTAVAATASAARVLHLVRRQPGISRIEIADRLGLNRSTVTTIVGELLDRGLINTVAEGDGSPNGGRKKIQLAINASYGCVGGVHLQADCVRVTLVDLAGRSLYRHVLPGPAKAKQLDRQLRKACEHLAQRAAGQLGLRLLGVGCGVPGVVDEHAGSLIQSAALGVYAEAPLVGRLEPELGYPLRVSNDARCCCWGERANLRDAAANFLFILGDWRRDPSSDGSGAGSSTSAVGIGLVLGGQVHQGRHHTAGEFRRAESAVPSAASPGLRDADPVGSSAARNDPVASRAALHELARNAAMLVHVLGLDRIYLGGSFDRHDVETQSIFTEEIRRHWTYPTPPTCDVAFSGFGEHAVAHGAAVMVLEHVFRAPDQSVGVPAPVRRALLF